MARKLDGATPSLYMLHTPEQVDRIGGDGHPEPLAHPLLVKIDGARCNAK